MNKHIAIIFAITISLISTTLFSQSSGITNNINSDIFELPTKLSLKQEKSAATFSIGAGYAVTSETRPGGYNIQLDLIFPVNTYLALNGSFNYARFPRYTSTEFYGSQNGNYLVDHGEVNYVTISTGLSYGNFKQIDKINYFITTGFALGFGSYAKTNYNHGGMSTLLGILLSGRVSYKISKQFQLFLEPSTYIIMSDDSETNYHINGGVSIAL